MRSLLLALLATSLSVGIIMSLSAGSGFDKYLQYLGALLICAALLSPLTALVKDVSFPDLMGGETDRIPEKVPDMYLRRLEAEIEKRVQQVLLDEFNLSNSDCGLWAQAVDQDGSPQLICLTVTLHSLKSVAYTGRIRDCLTQACGCEVVIREEIR